MVKKENLKMPSPCTVITDNRNQKSLLELILSSLTSVTTVPLQALCGFFRPAKIQNMYRLPTAITDIRSLSSVMSVHQLDVSKKKWRTN